MAHKKNKNLILDIKKTKQHNNQLNNYLIECDIMVSKNKRITRTKKKKKNHTAISFFIAILA